MKFSILAIFGLAFLLTSCEEQKTIELDLAEWECKETYQEYHSGYTTVISTGKTTVPVYHPSRTSTECAAYRLKEEILANRAKQEEPSK